MRELFPLRTLGHRLDTVKAQKAAGQLAPGIEARIQQAHA